MRKFEMQSYVVPSMGSGDLVVFVSLCLFFSYTYYIPVWNCSVSSVPQNSTVKLIHRLSCLFTLVEVTCLTCSLV